MTARAGESRTGFEDDGRDPRLQFVLEATKKVVAAREKIDTAASELRQALKSQLSAYAEFIDEELPIEGAASQRKQAAHEKVEVGPFMLSSQRVKIVSVTAEGMWVETREGEQYLMEMETVFHPQPAPPEIEL